MSAPDSRGPKRLAVEGRVDMAGPKGDATLLAQGDRARLSISNVRTAIGLLTLQTQVKRMAGIAPRLADEKLPEVEIDVSGWRIAKLKDGKPRPAFPARRKPID